MRKVYDHRHRRDIYMIDIPGDYTGVPEGAGTLMDSRSWPQFYNPDAHLPDCEIPDKMFRMCLCEEER